jgi:hypothetical protein
MSVHKTDPLQGVVGSCRLQMSVHKPGVANSSFARYCRLQMSVHKPGVANSSFAKYCRLQMSVHKPGVASLWELQYRKKKLMGITNVSLMSGIASLCLE